MQQRQLRLGDIVDDYCPRERRVTNHAIVAMIEQEVKQTRCTTCDAEHEYKAAKVPPQRKKKESTAALYKQVLSDAARPEAGALIARNNGDRRADEAEPEIPAPATEPVVAAPVAIEHEPDREAEPEEDGPVHRPLIRATLPRVEGQTPVRQTPDFTFRMTRPGRFRPGNGRGPQRPNRPQGQGPYDHARSAGSRPPGHQDMRGNRAASPQGRPAPRGPRHGRGKRRPK